MEIEQSSLYREIRQIITNGEKPVHTTWDALIHIGDRETIAPMRVISIDFNNDYLNNYAVEMQVTMEILAGTYAKRIYPFVDEIDITLVSKNIGEVSNGVRTDLPPSAERYTAILLDTGNPTFEMSSRALPSEDALNLSGPLYATFQLLDKSLEKIRGISVGNLYRDATGEDVVKALLTQACKSVNLDQDRKLRGVDMVPAANQTKRSQIVIPPMPVTELPHYIHFHCGGLYSAGLGYYLLGDYWYLYPCFDVNRFNQAQRTLTIINVPPNRFPGLERTYRLDGDNLVVVSTGQVKFRNKTNAGQLNDGNGVRFTDARRLMGKLVETAGNKVTVSRAEINSEFIADPRKNGNNVVKMGQRPINSNVFVEYSALAKRQGNLISFVWENANRSLLRPGMPVKILQLDGNKIIEVMGVLLAEQGYSSIRDPGFTSRRHSTSTMLGVFVKAELEQAT